MPLLGDVPRILVAPAGDTPRAAITPALLGEVPRDVDVARYMMPLPRALSRTGVVGDTPRRFVGPQLGEVPRTTLFRMTGMDVPQGEIPREIGPPPLIWLVPPPPLLGDVPLCEGKGILLGMPLLGESDRPGNPVTGVVPPPSVGVVGE